MNVWKELSKIEKIEAVKAAWFDGCSSRQIAKAVGAPSRNSIIGMFHRSPEELKRYPLRTVSRRPKMSDEEKRAREVDRARRYRARKRSADIIQLRIPATKRAAGDVCVGCAPVKTVEAPRFRVVSNNVDMMVKDYLTKHGARRFERGVVTDFVAIVNFLREHGHELKGKSAGYVLDGRPKSWAAVLGLVDEIRIGKGLEPILRQSA